MRPSNSPSVTTVSSPSAGVTCLPIHPISASSGNSRAGYPPFYPVGGTRCSCPHVSPSKISGRSLKASRNHKCSDALLRAGHHISSVAWLPAPFPRNACCAWFYRDTSKVSAISRLRLDMVSSSTNLPQKLHCILEISRPHRRCHLYHLLPPSFLFHGSATNWNHPRPSQRWPAHACQDGGQHGACLVGRLLVVRSADNYPSAIIWHLRSIITYEIIANTYQRTARYSKQYTRSSRHVRKHESKARNESK
jgi:hypothetical protein